MAKLKMKSREQNNAQCIRLSATLQLSDISQFYKDLRASIDNDNDEICFDASEIIQMSGAHVQVFISLFRWLHSKDVHYVIRNPSQAFLEMFSDMGMEKGEFDNLINARIKHE